MDIASSYKNKRALITGGLGFIGSNLARTLLDLGVDVTILDNADPASGAASGTGLPSVFLI